MANATRMLDDPQNLNAFLSMIGGTPIATRTQPESQNESDMGDANDLKGRGAASLSSPSPTRAYKTLEPIQESNTHDEAADILVQLAEASKLSLDDSNHAPSSRHATQRRGYVEQVVSSFKSTHIYEDRSISSGTEAIYPREATDATRLSNQSTRVGEAHEKNEDREHLIHFKTWGKAPARDKPAARIRKVMISNLPRDTDLTLVQALISGGAIDEYTLRPSGTTAYVTFTTGDACNNYCNKYPNGIAFNYQGRRCEAFVSKTSEVNVISGKLQGYLDCDATRCVRVVGADHDWSMAALKKLAEGQRRTRKVEAFTATIRDEVKTIVFRFTSIAHGVEFLATLRRDEEWEGCNIQFQEDPCAKATGIHLE